MRLSGKLDARHVIHIMLTTIMAWLAFILALPTDTFASSSSFNLMREVMPEAGWAFAFLVTAAIGVAGLVAGSALVRLLSVMAVSSAHGLFAAMLLAANPASTGSGTYAIVAGGGFYIVWRWAHDGV